MKKIGGRFHGTGAALYVCIGFVPDWIRMWNVETATPAWLEWNRHMAQVLCNEGIVRDTDGGALADLAQGEGIQTFYGGTVMNSTNQPSVTYGNASVDYVIQDKKDYRFMADDAVTADIDTWTLDSGYAGHFNSDVTGTYIAAGSEIVIDGNLYHIMVLTAAQGSAASEVTLSHTGVASGDVQYIGGRYGFKPIPIGDTAPAGFVTRETTVNESGMIVAFEAGLYDN